MTFAFHTQLFAVVSWGCAATRWLAKILNAHPEIFCAHALRDHWPGTGLDDVTYLQVLASQGEVYKAAGDVYGIECASISGLQRVFGQRLQAVVVVHDSAPRLYSQLALFAERLALQPWETGRARQLIATHGLRLPTGTYEEELLVHGVNMLNAIVEEQEVGTIYRCEDLTANPESLGLCIEELTRGVVSPTQDWLRWAVHCGPINSHRRETPPPFIEWQSVIPGARFSGAPTSCCTAGSSEPVVTIMRKRRHTGMAVIHCSSPRVSNPRKEKSSRRRSGHLIASCVASRSKKCSARCRFSSTWRTYCHPCAWSA
jgi:hypothetical protein